MTYRSRPIWLRSDLWRVLACVALFNCVINVVLAGYSFIDGSGFPPGNLMVAFGFGVSAIFCLTRARRLDR